MKYVAKISKHNYAVVLTDDHKNGTLVTKTTFLHNTKISISKFNEELMKSTNRRNSQPQSTDVILMDMYHVMLKYFKVYTDLNCVSIPAVPLELRAGIDNITSNPAIEDGSGVGSIYNKIRQALHLQE